jgi:hypothetical protein
MAGKSKLDVAALLVSIVALATSIASPFIAYNWLQSDVRVQQLKSRAIRAFSYSASSVDGPDDDSIVTMTHTATIKNEGALPVGKIEVIFDCQAGNSTRFVFAKDRAHRITVIHFPLQFS